MLQIISNSNETSTGAELVQNGDFSELGSDLVTNGDFSAAGSNLVSNPNFTATGSELVLNNDFSGGSTSWTVIENTGGSVTFPTNQCQIITDGVNGQGIRQFILTPEKSYKVVIDIASNTNQFQVRLGDEIAIVSGSGVQTFYGVATATDLLIYRVSGEASDVVLNSVSVKELGEDWNLFSNTEPIFNASGVTLNTSNGFDQTINQPSVISSGKSYKVTYQITAASYTTGSQLDYYDGDSYVIFPEQGLGTHTFYYTSENPSSNRWYIKLRPGSGTDEVTISSLVVQELGEGWTIENTDATHYVEFVETGARFVSGALSPILTLRQDVVSIGKYYKITCDATYGVGSGKARFQIGSINTSSIEEGSNVLYINSPTTSDNSYILRDGVDVDVVINNVTIQQLDPNGYWTLGTGWSIGDTKAISTVTSSNSDITQSILTAGKTYQTVFEVVDFTAGTVQAVVTGDEGTDRTAIETYTESLTATGTDFSIRSKLGTFDGSVSSVSAKLVGSYSDQSIYVTAADVQTIAQASVYYLVELTSMASKNSIYFLPSSVVPNNGRYTKLNFTVVSKDALTQPTVGIISFYDSVGGFDTYPMGFYEFRIYEQTSSTNLDPLLATGLLEKGFAFVRDFSGNMQELTDGFKEYDPTLTQYVYSK